MKTKKSKKKPDIIKRLDKASKLVILDRAIAGLEDVRFGEIFGAGTVVSLRAARLAEALDSLILMRAEVVKS
jgi:hypothetical protein